MVPVVFFANPLMELYPAQQPFPGQLIPSPRYAGPNKLYHNSIQPASTAAEKPGSVKLIQAPPPQATEKPASFKLLQPPPPPPPTAADKPGSLRLYAPLPAAAVEPGPMKLFAPPPPPAAWEPGPVKPLADMKSSASKADAVTGGEGRKSFYVDICGLPAADASGLSSRSEAALKAQRPSRPSPSKRDSKASNAAYPGQVVCRAEGAPHPAVSTVLFFSCEAAPLGSAETNRSTAVGYSPTVFGCHPTAVGHRATPRQLPPGYGLLYGPPPAPLFSASGRMLKVFYMNEWRDE